MGTVNLRRRRLLASVPLAGFGLSAGAQALYPTKPIRLIVPFSAGSASGMLARTVGERLQGAPDEPVLVENRPGSGGTIANAMARRRKLRVRSSPDSTPSLPPSLRHGRRRKVREAGRRAHAPFA